MVMAKINKIPSQEVQKALQMTPSLNGSIEHVENQAFVEALMRG